MEIGGYRTEELIGRGSAAQVWRAVGPDGQRVALKVYSGPYEQSLAAAKREAALAAQIDHPHLAPIRAVVCDHDAIAIAVHWAAGGSLASVLRVRGMLTPGETLTVLIPIASALATAHERGVVHGDLSPGNIVFEADGRPLLVDLGAAGIGVECGFGVSATPGYVAPEVARNAVPSPAADVFALGAVALHCLTGRPAWNADDLRDVVVQATVGQWPDPDDDAGPAPLVRLIRSMLTDVPSRRPGAATVSLELPACGTPEPVVLPAVTASRGRHAAPETVGDEDPPDAADLLSATRRRADAPMPAVDEPPRQRRRVNARAVGLVMVALVIGVLAIQSGLLWGASTGGSGSSPPPAPVGSAAASQAGPAAATPTASASGRASDRATGGSGTRGSPINGSSTPGSNAPGSRMSGPMPVVETAGKAATEQLPSAPAATAESKWEAVIRDLDTERALALVERDPERLAAVYLDGCAAREADAKTITSLTQQRIRVDGASHRIEQVRVIPDGESPGAAENSDSTGDVRRITVVVTDSLPSYRLLDAAGAMIGRTPARPTDSRTIQLASTTDGYRIAAIRDA